MCLSAGYQGHRQQPEQEKSRSRKENGSEVAPK